MCVVINIKYSGPAARNPEIPIVLSTCKLFKKQVKIVIIKSRVKQIMIKAKILFDLVLPLVVEIE